MEEAPAPIATVSSDELFTRWFTQREVRARDALIERFLPLARKLARRYSGSSEPYDDLVQVASLGLVKAVERFDPTRGFAFTSFAVPTIVGELKRYFRDTAWALHVDRSAQERARRITDARREVGVRHRRSPTITELAVYLECSEEEVLDGLQIAEAYDTVSLDAPRGGAGEADRRLDTLGDEDVRLELVDEQTTVFAAAQQLCERDRTILYLRFGEDLTQAEIAALVGVSQMQVSRLLRKS
ncbi:MAG: SigB/SigF/SigG family RNA polymerase sigma factor, partial [Solirubrobacteraceae bacterium]